SQMAKVMKSQMAKVMKSQMAKVMKSQTIKYLTWHYLLGSASSHNSLQARLTVIRKPVFRC
ncbi:MAG: hypothetical protein ACPGSM_17250, partial [Thiolinea sp.]